jgi:hypothetical protein
VIGPAAMNVTVISASAPTAALTGSEVNRTGRARSPAMNPVHVA